MYLELKNATLDDVAKDYKNVLKHAKESRKYFEDLHDLISECIGDDFLPTVLRYPDAFKAMDDNGFAAWSVFVLDVESNIDKLISAGYERSDVLSTVADHIYYGSPYRDESPTILADTYAKSGSEGVKAIIRSNHAIDESYLDEIASGIGDLCDETLEIRSFLSGNN